LPLQQHRELHNASVSLQQRFSKPPLLDLRPPTSELAHELGVLSTRAQELRLEKAVLATEARMVLRGEAPVTEARAAVCCATSSLLPSAVQRAPRRRDSEPSKPEPRPTVVGPVHIAGVATAVLATLAAASEASFQE